MVRFSLVLLALVLVPLAAIAQDSEESSAAKTPVYVAYSAAGYGFSLELPDSGVISDPGDENWSEDEAVTFEWYGAEDDPVVMIQGRVDQFATDLDAETFSIFCEILLESWTEDPDTYTVITPEDPENNKPLVIRGREWNLIEIESLSSDQSETVYYSIFSSYTSDTIYTITMYYLEPVDDRVQAFGFPVIDSFKLTE